jgi:hypothetical protein
MATSPSPSELNIPPAPYHDQELLDLVKYAKEFGRKYGAPYVRAEKAFTDEFYNNADKLSRLRSMFGKQGSHAKVLIDGSEYGWQSFCPAYLGITPQHFNRQVKAVEKRRRKAELDAAERTALAGTKPLTATQDQVVRALMGEGYPAEETLSSMKAAEQEVEGEDYDSLYQASLAILKSESDRVPNLKSRLGEAEEEAEDQIDDVPAPGDQPAEQSEITPPKPDPPMSTKERKAWQEGLEEGRKRESENPRKETAHRYFAEYKDDLQAYMNEVQDMFAANGLSRKLIVLAVEEVALSENAFKDAYEGARRYYASTE